MAGPVTRHDDAQPPAPYRLRVWQYALLVLTVGVLTFVVYGGVLEDAGVLRISDDLAHFTFVEDGISFCELFINRIDTIAPVIRLGFFSMYNLFEYWWPPYGLSLLGMHILTVVMIAIMVATFTRSFVFALALGAPLALSYAFYSGVIQNWIYVFIYAQFAMLVLAMMIVNWYVRLSKPGDARTPLLVALGALTACSLFIISTGVIIPPAVGACALALRANRRQLIRLAAAVGIGFGIWLAVTLITWMFLGNPLPGTWRYGATGAEQPFEDKFMAVLSWGFLGLYMPTLPPDIQVRPYATVATLFVACLGLFLATVRDRRQSQLARIGLAALVLLVFYGILAARGRDMIALWHMRYNGYAMIFGLLVQASALGILLDVLTRHLPFRVAGAVRYTFIAALFFASAYVTIGNAQTVAVADMFVNRSTMWHEVRRTFDQSGIRDCPCQLTFKTRMTPEEMKCLVDAAANAGHSGGTLAALP